MKMYLILVMLFMSATGHSGNSGEKTKLSHAQRELYKLLQQQRKITGYRAIHIVAEFESLSQPSLDVTFIDAKNLTETNPDITAKHLLAVEANPNSTEVQDYENKIKVLADFKYSSIDDSDTKDGDRLEKFNYLDSHGKKIMSRWFDRETGFGVRSAFYDDLGNLRMFERYRLTGLNFSDVEGPDQVMAFQEFSKGTKLEVFDLEKLTLKVVAEIFNNKKEFFEHENEQEK